ncbi:MAG: thiamine-phosphate kinase [Gammaproteobacteria bacterium]|nr:thiamine-phosphate kinase [Gammaproteobacteria bacterium]
MSEFDLINQFFKNTKVKRDDVLLGIGDDCAMLSPPSGKTLAVSTDTLISGVHFPESTSAEDIAYKSLAVNLSDLAAMGAEPAWVSLAISLPDSNVEWLAAFMRGFNELAERFNVALIGGDTTQGALSITLNVTGFVDAKLALKRANAKVGDIIFVTGTIGDASIGLDLILNNVNTPDVFTGDYKSYCIDRLNRPYPQVIAGQLLTEFVVAAIDISDGLKADLNHICKASNVGAIVNIENLPTSDALLAFYNNKPDWQNIITAGDDYELCFTCSKDKVTEMLSLMESNNIKTTCIGEVVSGSGVKCMFDNELLNFEQTGYNHF